MKDRLIIISVVIVLILVLIAIQLLNKQAKYEVYGLNMSMNEKKEYTVSWLLGSQLSTLAVQVKSEDDDWRGSDTIKAQALKALGSEYNNRYQYIANFGALPVGVYQYRIVENSKVISDEIRFQVNEAEDSFAFIHVTDSQGTSESDYMQWGSTLDAAFKQEPGAKFILHGGDLTNNPELEQQWLWFFQYAKPLASIPFYPTLGNNDLYENDASYYQAHFNLPNNGASGVTAGTSYYVSYSNLLLITLNTEQHIEEQTLWLEQLLSEQADKHRWIIVSTHRGVYGANRYKEIDEWTKLYDKYKVDLVLQGHNHQYSRSYPINDGKILSPNQQGTIYVTLNAAGSKLNEEKKKKNYQEFAFQNGAPMYAIVRLTEQSLIYEAYDIHSKLLDTFTLQHRN